MRAPARVARSPAAALSAVGEQFALVPVPGASNHCSLAWLLVGASCGGVARRLLRLLPASRSHPFLRAVPPSVQLFPRQRRRAPAELRAEPWRQVHAWGSRCCCRSAGPLLCDNSPCFAAFLQAAGAAAGSTTAPAKLKLYVRYNKGGEAVSVTVDPDSNIADLKAEAKRELGMTEPSVQIVAHMATIVEKDDDMTVTAIDEKHLGSGHKVADLVRADGKYVHVIFTQRAPAAAATGGAGTGSGEWCTTRAFDGTASRLLRIARLTPPVACDVSSLPDSSWLPPYVQVQLVLRPRSLQGVESVQRLLMRVRATVRLVSLRRAALHAHRQRPS